MSCNNVYKENLKTMMAVSSCRQGPACTSNTTGIGPDRSYRSQNYHPDPRYRYQSDPLYIPTDEACRQLKNNRMDQTRYNEPKQPAIDKQNYRQQGQQDTSNAYPHRDINFLYNNLQHPNARPSCPKKPRTFYVCSECGCSYPEGPEDRKNVSIRNPNNVSRSPSFCTESNSGDSNSNKDCRQQQDPARRSKEAKKSETEQAEVTVQCEPEKIAANGSQIIYFRFKINKGQEDNQDEPNRPCPPNTNPNSVNDSPGDVDDLDISDSDGDDQEGSGFKIGSQKSPLLWWNCNTPGCLCQAVQKPNGAPPPLYTSSKKKATNQRSPSIRSEKNCPVHHHNKFNGQKQCVEICTIRGEGGEILKIPCHHCFIFDPMETEQVKNGPPSKSRDTFGGRQRASSNQRTQNSSQNSNKQAQEYDGADGGRNDSRAYICRDIERRKSTNIENRNQNNQQEQLFDPRCQNADYGDSEVQGQNRQKKAGNFEKTSPRLNNERKSDNPNKDKNQCGCGCVCHNFPPDLWENKNEEPTYSQVLKRNEATNNLPNSSGKPRLVQDRQNSNGRVLPSNGGNAL